jgi:hypothetical protein
VQLLQRVGIGQVALVVLDHQGHVGQGAAVGRQAAAQLGEGRQVLLDAVTLGIDHEDHAIHLVQQLLAGRHLVGAAGNGDDVEPGAYPAKLAQLDRQHFVVDARVEARRDPAQLTPVVAAELAANGLDVGRLTRALGSPVEQACVDLGLLAAELGHQIFPFFCSSRRA